MFLANKPGTLAEVCDALAADRVNIYGLTISDTVDHAVVRMVVSDTRKALAIFESRGTLVVETDVIMIENDNKPGSLSRIASILSTHKINIEYAYLASMPTAKKGLLILRVQDPNRALKVLSKGSRNRSSRPAAAGEAFLDASRRACSAAECATPGNATFYAGAGAARPPGGNPGLIGSGGSGTASAGGGGSGGGAFSLRGGFFSSPDSMISLMCDGIEGLDTRAAPWRSPQVFRGYPG